MCIRDSAPAHGLLLGIALDPGNHITENQESQSDADAGRIGRHEEVADGHVCRAGINDDRDGRRDDQPDGAAAGAQRAGERLLIFCLLYTSRCV